MGATMRAMATTAWGGPDNLELVTVDRPEPGPGEVLVQVAAAGLNPVDAKVSARGLFLKRGGIEPPVVLGWDVSGTVAAVGEGVATPAVGDEVFGLVNFPQVGGCYAEFVLAPADQLASKPTSIDHVQAASLPLVTLTAWQGLFDLADLRAGQKLLVHAAAGGVGSVAVQLARWKGATVAGTASTGNQDLLAQLGVDTPIDYTTERFEDRVSNIDVVFDGVAGEIRARTWAVMKPGAILVSISGPVPEEESSAHGMRGVSMLVAPNGEQLATIAGLVDAGHLQAIVDHTVGFAEIAAAHETLLSGHGRGKIVLIP